MGSWSDLRIAGHPVDYMKSTVDPTVMTMFGGEDRKVYVRKRSNANPPRRGEFDEDEEQTVYEYRSTAREVAERLDIMSFTLREAEARFVEGAEYAAEMQEH